VQDVDNVCAHMLRNGCRDLETIEWQEARSAKVPRSRDAGAKKAGLESSAA